MSEMWTDDDFNAVLDAAGDNSTIKILRAKIEADGKAMKALQDQVKNLSTAQRGNLVEGALKSAGLKTGAASLYQGESDPTAIQAWVDANKDILARDEGFTPPPAVEGNPEQQAVAGTPAQMATTPTFTPDTQMAYQRMITAGIDGQPSTNFTETLGSLQNANSMEELMGIIMNNQ